MKVKDVASGAFAIVVLAVLLIVAALLIVIVSIVAETVLGSVMFSSVCTLLICVFVLLPLTRGRRTRRAAGTGLVVSSFVFGVTAWAASTVVAFDHWGGYGLAVGYILLGVGIAPVAVLAALFNSAWLEAVIVVFLCALAYGARVYGLFVRETKLAVTTRPAEPAVITEGLRLLSDDALQRLADTTDPSSQLAVDIADEIVRREDELDRRYQGREHEIPYFNE
jgi:hypothetical protein